MSKGESPNIRRLVGLSRVGGKDDGKRWWSHTLWLFNDRLALSLSYYGTWDRSIYQAHENGGRLAYECWDGTLTIWRVSFNVTIWGLGWLARITGRIPDGRNGRGYWWRPGVLNPKVEG
jgi:hypothetical protein